MKTPILTALLAGTLTAAAAPDYTLHEWGTFTTLSTSEGALLPGVQREEEPLPEFVETHAGMLHPDWMRAVKGWFRPLAGVTVRMETPVIYFYTKQAFDVHVDVGFKGGSISQWYPDRSGGETPPPIKVNGQGWPLDKENTLDFSKGYNGGIQWDVKVEPAGEDAAGRVFKPGETPSWIYPRNPDSAIVTTKDGQSEKYLFYRGLGQLSLPVTFSSKVSGSVTIKNTGSQATGTLLVYERSDDGSARWATVEALAGGTTTTVDLVSKPGTQNWKAGVYADGIAMLTKAGLYRKEADAMMQTWWPSYFNRAGLRVFWVVPRAFTDTVLPLTASPAPKETVRVLVGRSEVMTPQFESRLVSDFAAAEKEGRNRWDSDRYFPAFIERVRQINARTASAGTQPEPVTAKASR
ncbi:MAG TPA: hypothetical protein VHM91_10855 [Verrucomicrobiales bacterium]|nr:hypothetical protein [Verrucomicrobiales bacterium]